METALEKFDRLDILIHNAGWVADQSVQDLTPEFLQRAISINLTGTERRYLLSCKDYSRPLSAIVTIQS